MLNILPQTRDRSLTQRIGGIIVFALLTALAAQITIPLQPVPVTLQTFAVLLAGMLLGGRDGALSQLAYLAAVAIGLPFAAGASGGAAILLTGPTGGYFLGFIAAAFVTGLLVERGPDRWWMHLIAGAIGAVVIYLFGVPVLAVRTGLSLEAAILAGAAPFILIDLAKAGVAATVCETLRRPSA